MSHISRQLFRDNEIQTNRVTAYTLLGTGLLLLSLYVFSKFELLALGGEFCDRILMNISTADILVFAIAKFYRFEPVWMKYANLLLLTLTGAMIYMLYPLNGTALLFAPIIVSALYYDRRLVLGSSVMCWALFSMSLWMNVILEGVEGPIRELHALQEITVWRMPATVLFEYQLPHTVMFGIYMVLCNGMTRRGENFVRRQSEVSATISAMEAELNAAAAIQLSSLPGTSLRTDDGNLTVSAVMRPARTVGGDFYDYYQSGNYLVFLAADVSDKGLSAAMFMMKAKNAVRTAARHGRTVEEVMQEANKALCRENPEMMFVTLWLGVIDVRTGIGKYSNAGHLPPVIRHADGTLTRLTNEPDLMLGAFDDAAFACHPLEMVSGDLLVLFTDGLTDAEDSEGRQFGMERFESALSGLEGSEEPCTALLKEIDGFSTGASQFDDITILTVSLSKTEPAEMSEFTSEAVEGSAESALDKMDDVLREVGCPEDVRRNLDVVMDELISNICEYAYPDSCGSFKIELSCGRNFARFKVTDQGIPFDPNDAGEPDTDNLRVGGLGIHLVRELTDRMEYSRKNGENCLSFLKIWGI